MNPIFKRICRGVVWGVLFLVLYSNGRADDDAVRFNQFCEQAQSGHVEGMLKVGFCYEQGTGVEKDAVQAIVWYEKAVRFEGQKILDYLETYAKNANRPVLMCALGSIYARGVRVSKDEKAAVIWYKNAGAWNPFTSSPLWTAAKVANDLIDWRTAAATNDANAMKRLAAYYHEGLGVPQDHVTAAKWLRKAVEAGNADAMLFLARCHLSGETGFGKDNGEGIKWLRKAVETGSTNAMTVLGHCYYSGDGVSRDYAEAVKWYRKAATGKDGEGMLYLGFAYRNGKGVEKSVTLAYTWFNLASINGVEQNAATNRDEIERTMTPTQVAEGQRIAKEFQEKGIPPPETLADASQFAPPIPVEPGALPTGSGTGFFVTPDGYLVTAAHVVEHVASVKVRVDDNLLDARVIRTDARNDIALLKVAVTNTALAVVSSKVLKLGADVFTLGFPNIGMQGIAPKLTKGIISALTGMRDDPRELQISVAVQPGNSGGPLMDSDGNVVGVVVARLSDLAAIEATGAIPQMVNYAVKSAYILPLLEAVPETSKLLETRKAKTFADAVHSAESAVCLVLVYR